VLIDPGDEPQRILAALGSARTRSGAPIRVEYLLHTHAHLDHIGGTRAVRESLAEHKPRISLHRADELIYQSLRMQGQLFGIEYDDPLPIEHYLEDGQELRVGDFRLSVLHTPGHSPGSVCLRLHEDSAAGARESVFSGDTLFKGSVGRTDLWGADQDQMFRNIRERLLTLDGDTRVCPGHGEESTIAVEKRENPFLA
jgi:hydroxyacylglutathione hydrolase